MSSNSGIILKLNWQRHNKDHLIIDKWNLLETSVFSEADYMIETCEDRFFS